MREDVGFMISYWGIFREGAKLHDSGDPITDTAGWVVHWAEILEWRSIEDVFNYSAMVPEINYWKLLNP